jgi:hypothetical protein
MSKYLSQQKLWLDPTIEVLRNSQGKGRTLESLHGCDLLVLKDGHAEVRSLAVETGSAVHAGGIAMHLVHVAPSLEVIST